MRARPPPPQTWPVRSVCKKLVNKNLTVPLDISPFDKITISPVYNLAALRSSALKIRRRAARGILSESLFSSTVNVLDCRVAIEKQNIICAILSFRECTSPKKGKSSINTNSLVTVDANDYVVGDSKLALASYAAEFGAGFCNRTFRRTLDHKNFAGWQGRLKIHIHDPAERRFTKRSQHFRRQ